MHVHMRHINYIIKLSDIASILYIVIQDDDLCL